MIIENMSPQEVYYQMERDIPLLNKWLSELIGKELRSKFAHSSVYPCYGFRKWRSPMTNTQWEVLVVCENKKETNSPTFFPYVKFDSSNGKGAYLYRHTSIGFFVMKYVPHFFARFRQRYIEPNGIDLSKFNGDIIQYYFLNNQELSLHICGFEYCYGSGDQGSIFGTHVWNHVCVIKTYINNDILTKAQRQRLDALIAYLNSKNEPDTYIYEDAVKKSYTWETKWMLKGQFKKKT